MIRHKGGLAMGQALMPTLYVMLHEPRRKTDSGDE